MNPVGGGDRLPLRAHGMVTDTETAALVADDGTIDWWCPRRFDGDAAFFALLDRDGGAMRVGPASTAALPVSGTQSYDGDTHVLSTVLPAPEGDVEVVDVMPWIGTGHRAAGRIVRLVTARRGVVDVEVAVRPGARWRAARDVSTWSGGIAFDGVVVRTGCEMDGQGGVLRLEAGETAVVTIDVEPDDGSPLPEALSLHGALDLVDRTRTAWTSRVAPMTYDGPYAADVRRSLLVLLGLQYGPSGTVVAAATTSLPERVGGERNWDYRYAWIRDASLAIDACYDAGLHEEAERFFDWVVSVCGAAEFPMRPFYDVDGHAVSDDEQELPLGGWRGSQPVRVGNGASDHLQLDFYADLAAVLHEDQVRGNHGDASGAMHLLHHLVRMSGWLAHAWTQRDRGIWEIRAEPRHLVASKLACWYALDRVGQLEAMRSPLSLAAAQARLAAREVVAWLEANAFAVDGGLRADDRPTEDVDAALLAFAWRNPWPHEPWRVERTIDRILRRLSTGPFVHRYPDDGRDGLPPGEGAFLACSFWAVEALARVGRWEEAHERMEALCAISRPLGLLPEEVDPATGEWLGNLPQALSHLALVQAAIALTLGPR
ncbi:MAG TPA: glycoside hydrolase family 15 protein [Acidimicrobiales bacterium]